MEKEVYFKTPLTIDDQLEKLRRRGLNIDDYDVARDFFSKVSYYRLRAYTYRFQDNKNPEADHRFVREGLNFTDFIKLYYFDERLRTFLLRVIGKIEIAFRTKIIQSYSELTNNAHWFCDESLFRDKVLSKTNKRTVITYHGLMEKIESEVSRAKEKEEFIKKYYAKYHSPSLPPSWMTLEVLSFGPLTHIYELLLKTPTKTQIAKDFGLPNIDFMEQWMRVLLLWRNICAHQGRVWNRRTIEYFIVPQNTLRPFIDKETEKILEKNDVFTLMCSLQYLCKTIEPDYDFKQEFMSIIPLGGRLLDLRDMGFPDYWEELELWKI